MKHIVGPEYAQVHILHGSCFLRGLMDPPKCTRKGLDRYEISNSIENPFTIFSNGAIKPIVNLLDIQRLLESCSRKQGGEALMRLDATLATFENIRSIDYTDGDSDRMTQNTVFHIRFDDLQQRSMIDLPILLIA